MQINRLLLPKSDYFGTILSILVADIDLDGSQEILLGKELKYKLKKSY